MKVEKIVVYKVNCMLCWVRSYLLYIIRVHTSCIVSTPLPFKFKVGKYKIFCLCQTKNSGIRTPLKICVIWVNCTDGNQNKINHVCSKISSATFALRSIKHILPINIRKIIYDSLIKSHLEYGILTWDPLYIW